MGDRGCLSEWKIREGSKREIKKVEEERGEGGGKRRHRYDRRRAVATAPLSVCLADWLYLTPHSSRHSAYCIPVDKASIMTGGYLGNSDQSGQLGSHRLRILPSILSWLFSLCFFVRRIDAGCSPY